MESGSLPCEFCSISGQASPHLLADWPLLPVFGVSELAARLPIAMAAVGGGLVTWAIGRDLFGDRAGFLARRLTDELRLFYPRSQALLDPVFSCVTTLSFFWFLRTSGAITTNKLYSLLFSCSMALAVLTKGLLGLFPLFVIASISCASQTAPLPD